MRVLFIVANILILFVWLVLVYGIITNKWISYQQCIDDGNEVRSHKYCTIKDEHGHILLIKLSDARE